MAKIKASSSKVTISIAICTYNRNKQLKYCLQAIQKQTQLPDRLIVIEKVFQLASTSKNQLKKMFPKIILDYKQIRIGNISYSRNLAINFCEEDVLLFVDDDVILKENYLENLINIYQTNTKINCIVGKIQPTKSGYWQFFIHRLLTSCIKNENQRQIVEHWPSLNSSFRKKCFLKIKYDENLSALEDLDLCFNLQQRGYKINYEPQLLCFHNYKKSLKTFVRTFLKYYRNNLIYFENKNKNSGIVSNKLLSTYKKNKLSTCYNLIKNIWSSSRQQCFDLKLSKKYMFACMIYYCVWHYAILTSINSSQKTPLLE